MLSHKDSHWWLDAKFGLFIHWGLYAVPAGEWKGQKTRNIAEWIMHDLKIPREEYARLAERFDPKEFDAENIAKMAKDAGMRYLVLTAKHHDGFSMFHTKADPWNVVDATPWARDIAMAFRKACEKHGLKLGFYYSQAQDWHHPGGLETGVRDENPGFQAYLDTKCFPQVRELLTNYGDIGLIWFDTPISMTREQSAALKALVKDLQPDCLISGRIGSGLGDYMTTGDNFIPLLPYPKPFEVPATINGTWGYNRLDTGWKSAKQLLRDLVRVVSRGGNYLLNVGPDELGRVPEGSAAVLREIGAFLHSNGESVYETRPVPAYPYDLPWLGMTARKGTLYLHVFEPRKDIYLLNMGNRLKRASLLHDGRELPFWQGRTCEGVFSWSIRLPEDLPETPDLVVKAETEEDEIRFEPIVD